jgi:aspartyl-tRNA(Asn)/glutamyl-tRNA(Gln) amidotransferase subunit C
MVSPDDVQKIADLADISLSRERLGEFTREFNAILDYFDVLDTVREEGGEKAGEFNVMREDEITPSLPQGEVLALPRESEEGFIRAPRVME